MWACRRQACESASRCRSTLNNELIFLLGRVLSIGFDVADLAFSIAVAVLAVAVAEYVMWIFEQNGGIGP
jgi:hypothetical protein